MISPPTHAICAPYFFVMSKVLFTGPIQKRSISPPTLANAPPTSKVVDSPGYSFGKKNRLTIIGKDLCAPPGLLTFFFYHCIL